METTKINKTKDLAH